MFEWIMGVKRPGRVVLLRTLQCEELESRTVLATFRWDPVDGNLWAMGPLDGNIFDPRTNWQKETNAGTWDRVYKIAGTGWPKAGDVAEFWGDYNQDCIVNIALSVGGIRTYAPGILSSGNYTANLSLQ